MLRESIETPARYGLRQWSGWILGPGLLLLTLLIDPPGELSLIAWRTAGAACLMAVWWLTEPVPISVTALLPLVLFPMMGMGSIKEVSAPYAHPLVFLFLGGFMIALAMQRWGLHKRVAIGLIGFFGVQPNRIIAGFLVAGALVSMWVSNTATALMMLPIATSVVALLPKDGEGGRLGARFAPALMLAVAYGATTGGMATLIGTPPNALLAGYMSKVHGYEIGFLQWMKIGLPMTLLTLPLVYLVLTRVAFRFEKSKLAGMEALIKSEKEKLSKLSRGEAMVAFVFCLTALGWMFRPMLQQVLPMISDTSIAIGSAILLFLLPVNAKRGEFVMNWQATKDLPWEVLLLFGGGLSLAGMIQSSGLSQYIGELTQGLSGRSIVLILAAICFGILMLTELTSNTATAATFLPIIGAVAVSMGENPLLFLAPAALSANCSYMMPVGTPPNAIVFGSGRIALPQMARAGLLLNLLLVPALIVLLLVLGPYVFGIEVGTLPDWAK
ncbi:SLC13 family permease [Pelagicoccus mobilis]|uniref:SLC13/DASS family transporter n=1 Tax=Pelagicoccus mobilis TaxID=415221 RepID=A0A934VQY8_9BACT|nr:SLC13 family permease [Pelagicoccus mobilis]MBK1876994.1 SLC13/DASS family transporter [Pelagicoccus mobilis]